MDGPMIATRATAAQCSPSGLLTRAAWEREIESRYDDLPGWYGSAAERDRRFVRWVEYEATALAEQLARLKRPGLAPALARHLHAVIVALTEDADWARHSASLDSEAHRVA